MKTIIAGGRWIRDYEAVVEAIKGSGFEITEVVSGGATGVDALGERWAEEHGVPVKVFRADWNKYGRAAGPMRNTEMAEYAEALVAVWDGGRGTRDMIERAKVRGLKVHVRMAERSHWSDPI